MGKVANDRSRSCWNGAHGCSKEWIQATLRLLGEEKERSDCLFFAVVLCRRRRLVFLVVSARAWFCVVWTRDSSRAKRKVWPSSAKNSSSVIRLSSKLQISKKICYESLLQFSKLQTRSVIEPFSRLVRKLPLSDFLLFSILINRNPKIINSSASSPLSWHTSSYQSSSNPWKA